MRRKNGKEEIEQTTELSSQNHLELESQKNSKNEEKREERVYDMYKTWLEGKRSFLTQVVIMVFLGSVSFIVSNVKIQQQADSSTFVSLSFYLFYVIFFWGTFEVFLVSFLLEASFIQNKIVKLISSKDNFLKQLLYEKWIITAIILTLYYIMYQFLNEIIDLMFTDIQINYLKDNIATINTLKSLINKITGQGKIVIPLVTVGLFALSDIVNAIILSKKNRN